MRIIQPRVTMGEPRPRFGDGENPVLCLERTDREHTPDNKRPGQVHSSRATLTVTRYWEKSVAFELQEVTQANAESKHQLRTISMTMPREEAERFARFILEGK